MPKLAIVATLLLAAVAVAVTAIPAVRGIRLPEGSSGADDQLVVDVAVAPAAAAEAPISMMSFSISLGDLDAATLSEEVASGPVPPAVYREGDLEHKVPVLGP
ncbi:hypothetical protein GUJ93_ZPchr0003g17144 [Zizania palustris]|uniref:Uncharacterized protein n=1 Tax=Zizania palustris TaxID=103762 RepID=A0A8J5VCT9_ZIZPA|nr:hypothetical protein GUJ93_ZPchr0003g17144 [Zizania palustris]